MVYSIIIKNVAIYSAIPADKLSAALVLLSVSDNSSSPSILKNGAASVSPDIAGIAAIYSFHMIYQNLCDRDFVS